MKRVTSFGEKIILLALILIVGSLLLMPSCKAGEEADPESIRNSPEVKDKAKEEYVLVGVAPVIIDDLIMKFKSPGEAVTDRHVILKSEVPGWIKALNVEEGQHVNKGDLLVKLDDQEYKLTLDSAEAVRLKTLSELLLESQFSGQTETAQIIDREKLDKAEQKYEANRQLYKEDKITEKELDESYRIYELILIESGLKKEEIVAAAKGLTQAEITVKKARLNLEKTNILAPFSGIIADIKISLGVHVSGATELFTLVNLERIRVRATVLESEIGKIKLGREVELKFSAYPDRIFKGSVKAISPIVNPEDKTCKVLISLSNPDEEIKPGMHAQVEIVSDIFKDRMLVPQEAFLIREGRKMVFVYEDGLAKWRYVQTGFENEVFAEILPTKRQGEGVKEGEFVLIKGHFNLGNDARIKINN